MKETKSVRTREYQIKCRMNKQEYEQFQKKLQQSGQTQQSFLLNAISSATIVSLEEVELLKEMNQKYATLLRQIRGLAVNINQMAHIANGTGRLPMESRLLELGEQISEYRKESESQWQSIRQLISKQRHMEL